MAVEVDPAAEGLMRIASGILRAPDMVRRQRRRLWALMLEHQRSAAMCDLADTLLAGDR